MALATDPRLRFSRADGRHGHRGIAAHDRAPFEAKQTKTIILVDTTWTRCFASPIAFPVLVYGRVIATDVPERIKPTSRCARPTWERKSDARGARPGDSVRRSQVLFGIDLAGGASGLALGRTAWQDHDRALDHGDLARQGRLDYFRRKKAGGSAPTHRAGGLGPRAEAGSVPNSPARKSGSHAAQRPWTLERIFKLFPHLEARKDNYGKPLRRRASDARHRRRCDQPRLLILDEATRASRRSSALDLPLDPEIRPKVSRSS